MTTTDATAGQVAMPTADKTTIVIENIIVIYSFKGKTSLTSEDPTDVHAQYSN